MFFFNLQDRSVVDELLSLESEKLKFAKRKLRLQRCKTLPGTTLLKSPASAVPIADQVKQGTGAGSRAIAMQNVPKGDPLLGDKLRALSKEERKAAKSADPNRVARRLAKKKARNALDRQGVKSKGERKGQATLRKESKGQDHRKAMS